MKDLLCALAIFAMVFGFTTSASAAGGGNVTSNLSDSFDLGDIRGGYDTSVFTNSSTLSTTDLYAYVDTSHKVDNSSLMFFPNYDYVWDNNGNPISRTLDGYRVQMSMQGRISSSLTLADTGSLTQSNLFNARGLVLSENSWSNVWDEPIPYGGLTADVGSEIEISNFKVQSAGGYYNEYTYNDPNPTTYFQYNVTWSGDFLPGTLTSGFVAPAMETSVSSVPEPSTWALLLAGLGGVLMYRRRWF